MSRVVLDPTHWADRAVGTFRDLVGADRFPREENPRADRWLAVTVHRQPDDVRARIDDPGPLDPMRGDIELVVRPAPGDRGTELAARPTASDGGSTELRRTLRAALRATKSLLECGEVVEPSHPGSSHPGAAGRMLRAVTARAWGEGRL